MPTGLMIPQIGSLTQKQKRVIVLLCFAAVVLFLLMMPAFAQSTTTTIETEIKKGTQSIYVLFKAILAPIAVVMVVWNVYKALFLGDKGMESAKKGVLIIHPPQLSDAPAQIQKPFRKGRLARVHMGQDPQGEKL